MKKINVALATFAFGFMALSSCRKDDLTNFSGSLSESLSESQVASGEGVVYTMDNATTANHIMVFKRAANGTLTRSAQFPTGGTGTGQGLGSQGAIVAANHRLFVCNAGSNDITVFEINGLSLKKTDKTISHGTTPISLTVYGDLLYVLNTGGTGNISGFRIGANGRLSYLNKSKRKLSSDTSAPAQIKFNRTGTQLVVTEKATNLILTYEVNADGSTGSLVKHPSAGITPFGFEFGKHNELIVSEAFGGATNASALSSYKLKADGNLKLITGSVATNQTAACWVAITPEGGYCYTTNTGSNSISGYKIGDDGALTLIDANGITGITGGAPIDMAMSRESKYLYTLNSGSGSISAFKISNNGGLTSLCDISGIPMSATGLTGR